MSGKSPFNLAEVLQGRGEQWLSADERLLLKFTLDRFGEPLTQFLLTGLSEVEAVSERLFTIAFTGPQGARYNHEVLVRADYRPDTIPCLPQQKEPLVVLALLWLLVVERQMFSFTLSYGQEEVLGLLGWEDTQASRLRIDEAVSRYSRLYYEWTLDKQELEWKKISSYNGWARFVSGRGYEDAEDAGEMKRVLNFVRFDEVFVREMLSHSLFGIDWDNCCEVEYVNF